MPRVGNGDSLCMKNNIDANSISSICIFIFNNSLITVLIIILVGHLATSSNFVETNVATWNQYYCGPLWNNYVSHDSKSTCICLPPIYLVAMP